MTDLTEITTPFGLLDDETQEALKAHGGPYEVFTGSRWEAIGAVSSAGCMVYRVKPAPPKPRVRWAVMSSLKDTEEEAQTFLAELSDANPGLYFGQVTKWVEVLP